MRPGARRRRRPSAELVGLIGAVVAFVGFGSYYALVVPPFAPPDEQAHVAYGAALAHGQLPRIDTPDRRPARGSWLEAQLAAARDDRYREVWVSNHPPLHHLLLAPLLRVADATGHANLGLVFARYLNLLAAAGGIVATYLLGSELAGGSRRVGLAAAALMALLPHPQYMFARAQNDGLAFATVTLALWACVRYLRRGHDAAGLALVSATVLAAAATRAVGLLVGAVIAAAVVLFAARPTGDARPGHDATLRRALLRGAAVVGPTALLVGWFYVRNVVLYGDIGASRYLLARFDRRPLPGGTFAQLHDASLWRKLVSSTAGGTVTGHRSTHASAWVLGVLAVVAIAACVGLVVVVVARVLGARRPQVASAQRVSGPGIVVCVAAIAAVAVTVAQHVAGGGSRYPRYLFPGLGAAAALVAIGLDRIRPWLAAAFAMVVLAGASVWLIRPTARLFAADVTGRPLQLSVHVGNHVVRSASLGFAALGLVVLFSAFAYSMMATTSPDPTV